jgi:hypothetical protein
MHPPDRKSSRLRKQEGSPNDDRVLKTAFLYDGMEERRWEILCRQVRALHGVDPAFGVVGSRSSSAPKSHSEKLDWRCQVLGVSSLSLHWLIRMR